MKTILISAYSVNPYEGSEAGTGWNIINELAKEHKLKVITRHNNLPDINRYLESTDEDHLQNVSFHGFDLPSPIMNLKKKLGERGYVLYFYFWQLLLPLFVLKKRFEFDMAHALNFHSDSHPTLLWLFGKPTFWGPVGHHPKVPKQYLLKVYGKKAFYRDRTYAAVKWCMRRLDPIYWISKRMVDKVFVINSSVPEAIGIPAAKCEIMPAVGDNDSGIQRLQGDVFTVLSVGRFHYMKGFDIALESFALFLDNLREDEKSKVRFKLVGKGEERSTYDQIISERGLEGHVEIIDWVDRNDMAELYRSADVFLFPSHEGAGMVIPEAMSYGIPTVTFDNVGPGELAGKQALKVPMGSYNDAVQNFAVNLMELFLNDELWLRKSHYARLRFKDYFTWKNKTQIISKHYEEVDSNSVAVFHPSSELYGADRIMVNALEAYPKEVKKVVYLKFNGPLEAFIKEQVENVEVKVIPQLPVIYRAIFTPKGIVQFAAHWFFFLRLMRNEKKTYRFSSAYINTLSTSFLSPITWFYGIKSFVHVHEIIENPKVIGWLTAVLGYWFSDKMICVSEAVRNNLLGYLPRLKSMSIVLHNGIDPIEANATPVREKLNFYLFGRIKADKGQWFLLDALKKLKEEELDQVNITLVGGSVPGKEHMVDDLNKEIKANNLSDVITLKGFSRDISEAMEKADVCLVPSLMKDPFPTTVLEAMSAGKPVIATNHGGAKEALNGSNCGILISPGDSVEFAQGIRYFIKNKNEVKKMGEASRTRYENNFTKKHFHKNWQTLVQNMQLA